jgi:hypothetical protein
MKRITIVTIIVIITLILLIGVASAETLNRTIEPNPIIKNINNSLNITVSGEGINFSTAAYWMFTEYIVNGFNVNSLSNNIVGLIELNTSDVNINQYKFIVSGNGSSTVSASYKLSATSANPKNDNFTITGVYDVPVTADGENVTGTIHYNTNGGASFRYIFDQFDKNVNNKYDRSEIVYAVGVYFNKSQPIPILTFSNELARIINMTEVHIKYLNVTN